MESDKENEFNTTATVELPYDVGTPESNYDAYLIAQSKFSDTHVRHNINVLISGVLNSQSYINQYQIRVVLSRRITLRVHKVGHHFSVCHDETLDPLRQAPTNTLIFEESTSTTQGKCAVVWMTFVLWLRYAAAVFLPYQRRYINYLFQCGDIEAYFVFTSLRTYTIMAMQHPEAVRFWQFVHDNGSPLPLYLSDFSYRYSKIAGGLFQRLPFDVSRDHGDENELVNQCVMLLTVARSTRGRCFISVDAVEPRDRDKQLCYHSIESIWYSFCTGVWRSTSQKKKIEHGRKFVGLRM